jgi:hypothetical protein
MWSLSGTPPCLVGGSSVLITCGKSDNSVRYLPASAAGGEAAVEAGGRGPRLVTQGR